MSEIEVTNAASLAPDAVIDRELVNRDAGRAGTSRRRGTRKCGDVMSQGESESLIGFLRRVESMHADHDVFAVAATHPKATDTVWPGRYSGIKLSKGAPSVTYSDGSKA